MPDTSAINGSSSAPRRRFAAGRLLFWIILTGLLLGGDLWLKSWSFANVANEPISLTPLPDALPYHEPDVLIPNVLAFHLTLNQGAVFGIGQGQRWLFVVISVLAIGLIGWMLYQTHPRQWLMQIALIAILAGALGNLYDRMRFGAVRDMLYLFPDMTLPGGLTWHNGDPRVYPWLFNLADTYLVCGIIVILILTLFARKAQESTTGNLDSSA